MSQFKQVLVEHRWVFILAILTSVIVSFPQIYFRVDHGEGRFGDGIYQGIELLPDSPWSARVREVQDGHPNFGSIYYKEGKGDPYLFQPLGSMVAAYAGKLFSLGINNTILLSRLALTFFTSLLIYAFVYLFSREKIVALCCTAVLLLAESILSYFGLKQILQGISPEDFLRIARPVNPAMIYILFFGFMTAFWLFYQKGTWRYGILSAILLGLNFYNYFYSWTFLYAFGGFLFLILIIRKNWQKAFKIGTVFVGALLLMIPYAINFYRATLHPAYAEASVRFGVIETHAPLFVGFVVIVALVIFLWKFPREDREKYIFGLALLLAPFLTMNQQLLTGKVLQAAHYHWFFHKPIAVIFTLIVVFYLLERYKLFLYKKVLAVLIISTSIATGVFVQGTSYVGGDNDGGSVAIERQKYGPVMKWLNANAEKEAVVMSNNETSHMVAIYTPLNLFYHRAAMYSLAATKERLLEVWFTFYRLNGVGATDAREKIFADRELVSANIYGMYYRELLGAYEAIPDEKIEEIVKLYEKGLTISNSKWLKQMMDKYEVEYIVWDKNNNPTWELDQYDYLNKVVDFSDYNLAIYHFRPYP
ncbi:MAG: hypothetical protein AAB513_00210 [Patescibacteria group bacterium]